jgi:hypothetical protein
LPRLCQALRKHGLLAHDFDDHPLVALTIELRIENALPGAEVELSGRDWNDYFMMDEQGF